MATGVTWDLIPLGWGDVLKLWLEMATIAFAVAPFFVLRQAGSLVDTVMALTVCFALEAASLVIMRVVETQMFEVLRKVRKGRGIWYNLR